MNYHNIVKDDFRNGDGIRTTVFLSGCEHKCSGCHNPETWNKDSGIPFDDAAKQEIKDTLQKSYVTGVTFSGGDPLATFNREEVTTFIEELKEEFPDKTFWIYTGYTKEQLQQQSPEIWERLESIIDVIVEGKFEIDKLDVNYPWAGSTNQRVLRKESLFTINTSHPLYIKLEKLKDEYNMESEYYDSEFNQLISKLEMVTQGELDSTEIHTILEQIEDKLQDQHKFIKQLYFDFENILLNEYLYEDKQEELDLD